MATKGRSAKKKDGARSVRHGNVTYSSRPSDNTDCRIRCSPPSKSTFGDGSKQTTVRYRHRTLDIKSPPSGKKRKPGVRTGSKTTTKTAKTAKKTVVKNAPAKKGEIPANLVPVWSGATGKPKTPAKKKTAVKSPSKTAGTQSMVQDAFETASHRRGFPNVDFVWEKDRPASKLGWDRGLGFIIWKMPPAFRKLSYYTAYDLADMSLARINTGEARPMNPGTVRELREVCGLKLAGYDADGHPVGTDMVPTHVIREVPGEGGAKKKAAPKKKSGPSMDEPVGVVCYGKEEAWTSRRQAIKFYEEGMMMSDGSERDRYMNIVADLRAGKKIARDE